MQIVVTQTVRLQTKPYVKVLPISNRRFVCAGVTVINIAPRGVLFLLNPLLQCDICMHLTLQHKTLCNMSTQCNYVFLRSNSDYFPNSNNKQAFVMEMQCVFCDVEP